MCWSILSLRKIAHQMWCDHPFSQRNKVTERTVGVGVGGDQEIRHEFNLGIGSHVSITFWWECCIWGVWGMGTVCPCCKPPLLLFDCISVLDSLIWNPFFLLTTHSNFSVLNLKLGVQTNYPFARMFFFCTLATAFPTSYHMKTVCSCWIWKLSNLIINLVPSASFLTQNDWLEKKANQSLCDRKEALRMRLMSTKTMVRCYVMGNVYMCSKAFYTSKVGLSYIGNSAISL